MVNILVTTGNFLEQGTSGDDVVTFEDDIFTSHAGVSEGNTDPTDTGVDTGILSANDLASLLAGGGVTYDPVTGWDFGAGPPASEADIAFASFTTSDGVTLEGGTAFADSIFTFDNSSITGGGGITPFLATIIDSLNVNTTEVSWDGATLTESNVAFVGNWRITGFDGNSIAAGRDASEVSADGFGQLTVDGSPGTLSFMPITSAISVLGQRIGEVVPFPYEVELTNTATGEVQSITVTFSLTMTWTPGDDVLDLNDFPDQNFDFTNLGASITESSTVGSLPIVAPNGLVGGNDLVIGNSQKNLLFMQTGNNTVFGAGGDDTLYGGIDDDLLRGGGGNDALSGSGYPADGNDSLIGGAGDDLLFALGGDDNLLGGDGDDIMNGGNGNDFFRAGDGDDVLRGDSGNDTLKGGAGDDVAQGGFGDDELHTSAGDNDILTGGDGADTFVLKAGTGRTEITDFERSDSDELDVTILGWTQAMFENGEIEFYVLNDGGISSTVLVIDDDTSVTLTNHIGLGVTDFEFA